MIVRALRLREFLTHKYADLVFPDTGITLLTGPNGSGKSAVLESISCGIWGKPLRGVLPWKEDVTSTIRVETDVVDVTRVWDGRASLVRHDPLDGDTAIKQVTLDEIAGDWSVWRATRVLLSATAARFGVASDGDRKRLLERLLGLERFDRAAERARKAHGAAEAHAQGLVARLAALDAKVVHLQQRVADAEGELAAGLPPEPPKPPGDHAGYQARYKALYDAFEATQRARAAGVARADAADRELAGAVRRLAQATEAGLGSRCYACGQELPAKALVPTGPLEAEVHAAQAALTAARAAVPALRAAEESAWQAAKAEEAAGLGWVGWLNWGLACERAQARLGGLRARLEGLRGELAAAEAERALVGLVEAERAARVQQGAVRVLGLTGVRARLFDGVLEAVEAGANGWLARLDGALRVELRPTKELASSRVKDAISLLVGVGAGAPQPYAACSGGQQRVVDLGLLLALADVAGAVHRAAHGGTLLCDEVFDALDAAHCLRAAEVLADLARERPVILVSHSAALAEALHPAVHYHVEHGKVTTV